jgi:hypothetical protein
LRLSCFQDLVVRCEIASGRTSRRRVSSRHPFREPQARVPLPVAALPRIAYRDARDRPLELPREVALEVAELDELAHRGPVPENVATPVDRRDDLGGAVRLRARALLHAAVARHVDRLDPVDRVLRREIGCGQDGLPQSSRSSHRLDGLGQSSPCSPSPPGAPSGVLRYATPSGRLDSMLTLWRCKINSGLLPHAQWDEARAHCRRNGVIGVGWGTDLGQFSIAPRVNEVCEAILRRYGAKDGKSGVDTVRRFAEQMQNGDLVWTRDSGGAYWLGRIEDRWRFDPSEEATRWDVNNARPCRWLERPARDFDVPGAVVRSFIGRAGTLARVHSDPARKASELLWEHQGEPPSGGFTTAEVLAELVDPIDLEDIVLIYLQAHGWLLMPSTRQKSTPTYEAVLRSRENGQLAVVSVKSGGAQVPIPELAAEAGEAKAFAFGDKVSAPPAQYGVEMIAAKQIEQFMTERPDLLPPRISRWLDTSEPASPHDG